MIGLGLLLGLLSLIGLWLHRRDRTPTGRWFYRLALVAPFLANSLGWIFTEVGRQPWVVYGMLRTADGVSPGVGAGSVLYLADRLHRAVWRAGRHRGRAPRPLRHGRPTAGATRRRTGWTVAY